MAGPASSAESLDDEAGRRSASARVAAAREHLETYRERLLETVRALDLGSVARLCEALDAARREERTVLIFGNGGSAATASHVVCDLVKGVSQSVTPRFRVVCLNDNVPTMMAWANDRSWADIFVEPLQNFGRPGDLVIGISGSGNSENVVRAIEWAKGHGMTTATLCGYGGGRLKRLADLVIHVPVDDMQVVEDVHLAVGHMVTQALSGGRPVACVAPELFGEKQGAPAKLGRASMAGTPPETSG